MMILCAPDDGVTDATAAFQAALASDSVVVVPRPAVRYRITAPLTVTGLLIGDGSLPEIFLDSTTSARLFNVAGRLEGLTIDGNKSVVPSGDLIRLDTPGAKVKDITLKNAPTNNGLGSILLTSTDCDVSDVRSTGCGGTVIGLSGSGVRNNTVRNCRLNGQVHFGIRLGEGAHHNEITGNQTTQSGIELIGVTSHCHDNRISGNHAEGCGDNGISISGYRNTVTGNVSANNMKAGIGVWGSHNVIASNIVLNPNCAGTYWPGVIVVSGFGGLASRNLISGNQLIDDRATPLMWNGVNINNDGPSAPQHNDLIGNKALGWRHSAFHDDYGWATNKLLAVP